ncbi:hypothetical protein BDY21DRAFT_397086 [Lineolata rhizophorae]|uniref:Zn(2)-C6 fungal-type domain-containing protein n=1 Tax=Lineolata rhizophorae TaxID=578093 RepID=A0A6A6NTH4_9PEZI|nr:hypothetical protein BDY21DRAFT_397086 [Lineolata rhizophorae]
MSDIADSPTGVSPTSVSPPSVGRKEKMAPRRVHRACNNCRLKKAKCNNVKPCEECERAGLVCLSTMVKKKKATVSTLEWKTESLLSERASLSLAVRLLYKKAYPNDPLFASPTTSSSSPTSTTTTTSSSTPSLDPEDLSLNDILRRIGIAETISTDPAPDPNTSTTTNHHLRPPSFSSTTTTTTSSSAAAPADDDDTTIATATTAADFAPAAAASLPPPPSGLAPGVLPGPAGAPAMQPFGGFWGGGGAEGAGAGGTSLGGRGEVGLRVPLVGSLPVRPPAKEESERRDEKPERLPGSAGRPPDPRVC